MGKRRDHQRARSSKTLPSSPSHSFSSSSSSDFEFTISLSPRTNSLTGAGSGGFFPADELFYKGQLLPLHLTPRISMVRTLLLASSSTSSSSTATASRDSTASSSSSDQYSCPSSGRPSSADHDAADLLSRPAVSKKHLPATKYFSLPRFSSVFKKSKDIGVADAGSSPVKRASSSAREVIRKYLKKVKPLYEKLSFQQTRRKAEGHVSVNQKTGTKAASPRVSLSFSGNLRYPMARRKAAGGHVSSCPSSMRSSPSHSGLLSASYATTSSGGGIVRANSGGSAVTGSGYFGGETASSMEELQSAIQGAIAHCKNSLLQKQISDPNINPLVN